jgi:hypothetical protein
MKVSETWGVKYIDADEQDLMLGPGPNDRYSYTLYVRKDFEVSEGDSAYAIFEPDSSDEPAVAQILPGGTSLTGAVMGVVIRGVMMEEQERVIRRATYLPYVNGCSTKQVFPPDRAGDPTLQYLNIPPYSAEQAHHIHSTTRVVYILAGKGVSVVGMEGKVEKTDLLPGMVCVLDPMCPHHFETPQGEALICMPVHVWSSSGSAEFNHPMFNGTHLMDQGT